MMGLLVIIAMAIGIGVYEENRLQRSWAVYWLICAVKAAIVYVFFITVNVFILMAYKTPDVLELLAEPEIAFIGYTISSLIFLVNVYLAYKLYKWLYKLNW